MAIVDNLIEISTHDAPIVLTNLIELFMMQTRCIGGKYKNVIYKELPNDWSCGDDLSQDDLKKECTGDDECNATYDIIEPEEGEVVKMLWTYHDNLKSGLKDVVKMHSNDDDYTNIFDNKSVIKYFEGFEKVDTNKLFFNGTIQLVNKRGINEDHRGSDHCEIELPFFHKRKLISPTLDDFISALYKLKSHKFDTNYEMYCGCTITKIKNGLKIELNFDHGS